MKERTFSVRSLTIELVLSSSIISEKVFFGQYGKRTYTKRFHQFQFLNGSIKKQTRCLES